MSYSGGCSHTEGETQRAVIPCVRCGEFVCSRCAADEFPHCKPCRKRLLGPLDARADRLKKGIPWSIGSGWLPVAASMFIALPWPVCLACAVLGGIWGGVRSGGRVSTCILYCIPGVGTPLVILYAMSFYSAGRSHVLVAELGFAALLATIPGAAAWGLAVRHLRRLELSPESVAILRGRRRTASVSSYSPRLDVTRRCAACNSRQIVVRGEVVACDACGYEQFATPAEG